MKKLRSFHSLHFFPLLIAALAIQRTPQIRHLFKMSKTEKYNKGMAIRREVLGDEYVDKAIDAATDFNKPLQDLLTENCWGEIWARDVIPNKTRSLITIATLAALKAPDELKAHVRGALRNGCTEQEIQEVLLQSTVYCGAPAGIEAFRAAKEAIETWHNENS